LKAFLGAVSSTIHPHHQQALEMFKSKMLFFVDWRSLWKNQELFMNA